MEHNITSIQYGPYTPVQHAGNLYFVSGQVGVDAATGSAPADISGQTRQALCNLKQALETAHLDMSDVVKTTVFLKDMHDFAAVNELYQQSFKEPRPARSCVEVAGLPDVADNELLVEIEAVAYRDDGRMRAKGGQG